jgi:glycosyltransferase involved in cell wall biosynthesis
MCAAEMLPAASIVIRTFNEARWLPDLLRMIAAQDFELGFETILVDSGSTDGTREIATEFGCRILNIKKEEFTFGRSLNIGCVAARGSFLVFISGHCVPADSSWLRHLVEPLQSGNADYVYGRQIDHALTRFSEKQLFAKYFPSIKERAQGGFFCNNANAAVRKDIWQKYQFDETLPGLEDMALAKRIIGDNRQVDYVPQAGVYHIHEESWSKIRIRYERESIALQTIMPEIHISATDFVRYFTSAVFHDSVEALREGAFVKRFGEILLFRLMQYWGSYRGNNDHRRLSHARKERYFYPR